DAQELVLQIKNKGRRVLALKIDSSDFEQAKVLIEKTKEAFGKLDFLVNNSGITRDKALMLMTKEDWGEVINTNLTGTFNVTRQAIVTFLKQKSGSIVNITSVSAMIGLSRQTNYASSKAGIIGFTRSLARETAPYNIRVNAVAPGFIETDMVSGLKPEYKEAMLKNIPLSRFGRTTDVASAVKFLLSDKASFITGQVLAVDGGLSIKI
ncbi:MAG: 3-oxoacyl-ACP reductase FabG, partial [Candidatus Omnitrophota bacterium]